MGIASGSHRRLRLGAARRPGAAGALLAVAACACGATESQAATWTAVARTALPAGADLGAARVTLGPDGRGLIDWVVAGSAPAGEVRSGLLVRRVDGTLGSPISAGRAITAAPVVLRDGTALLLGGRARGASHAGLSWAALTPSQQLRWHRLTGAALPIAPSLAANARGDAIAAWVERRGEGVRLRMALRRAGGSFGHPTTVFDDPATFWGLEGPKIALSTAVGGDGRMLLAYSGRPRDLQRSELRVATWVGTARRGLGRRMVVGRHEGYVKLATAVTTRHRAFVIWGSQSGGIEAGSPWRVRAASLPGGANRFGAVQVIDPGHHKAFSPSPVLAATEPGGRVIAAWGTGGYEGSVVRVVETQGGAAFGVRRSIPGSTTLTGLATRGDGAAAITWSAPSREVTAPASLTAPQPQAVGAAVRSAGTTDFAVAEAIGIRTIDPFVAHRQPPLGASVFDPITRGPITAFVVVTGGATPELELVSRQQ